MELFSMLKRGEVIDSQVIDKLYPGQEYIIENVRNLTLTLQEIKDKDIDVDYVYIDDYGDCDEICIAISTEYASSDILEICHKYKTKLVGCKGECLYDYEDDYATVTCLSNEIPNFEINYLKVIYCKDTTKIPKVKHLKIRCNMDDDFEFFKTFASKSQYVCVVLKNIGEIKMGLDEFVSFMGI